ncbi:hypothetical protein HDU88_005539 [Geranomyces variabilis]|nr:hypothetical protein HDU88_005539 [Geranomyces variabilis]
MSSSLKVYASEYPPITVPLTDTYSLIFDSTHAASSPRRNDTALIDANTARIVTYGELFHRVNALASGLVNVLNLKKWDVVAVYSPNSVEYPVAVHGCARAGITSTLLNPSYTVDEVAYQLSDSGAKAIIVAPVLLPVAVAAAAKVNMPKSMVFVLSDGDTPAPQGFKTTREISSATYLPPTKFTEKELKTRPVFLCYSSGTTGRSKGVVTTHYNMVSNILQFVSMLDHAGMRSPNEVWSAVLPLYHIYGINMAGHSAIYMKIPCVVFSKFDLPQFLDCVQKHKITYAHLVPPIIIRLAKDPIVDNYQIDSLKTIMSGAAPLAADVAIATSKRINCLVVNGYGLTESSPLAMFGTKHSPVGSVGPLVPNVEARLVDPDTGRDVPTGEPGELWIRGPMIMAGYHRNEKATAETIDKEGWLHTGDVAQRDAKGNYFIVDRFKELIKYNGLQVPPAELEGHLLTHPDIADAAVIGRPCPRRGELPRAYVVKKAGASLTAEQVEKFIEERVAQHKRLRGGVEFLPEIPKLASGKILRRVLREMDKATVEREGGLEKVAEAAGVRAKL